jgi:tetratricopeptide (TPR) repeat protein
MTKVSASLIVKNEERFISNCLASLRGHVDEIVVVDTGSSDGTAESARQFGARVLHFDWTGSFAEARNASLAACSGDWILYIDADECLRLEPGVTLSAQLSRPDWAGAMVKFQPKTGYTSYWEHRLFRRHPDISFEGRIHESYLRSLTAFAERHGLQFGKADVSLDHYGYDGDQSHKHPRNLPLLLDSIATTPGRPYYWYHLAETYAALGRVEDALEAGEQGLRVAAGCATEKEAADVNLISQVVTRLRIETGRDPSDIIEEALRRFPEDHAMSFLKARWLLNSGEAGAAIALLDQLLSIEPDSLPPGNMAFDKRIFGISAREMKAAALVQLGDLAGAGATLRCRTGKPAPAAGPA